MNMSNQYRKRPVIIEAIQIEKRMDLTAPEWWAEAVQSNAVIVHGMGKFTRDQPWAEIPTLEGVMRADDSDWIIRGIKGELYPCKDEIFKATYENAALSDAAQAPIDKQEALRLIKQLRGHSPIYDGAELVADIGPTHLEQEAASFIESMIAAAPAIPQAAGDAAQAPIYQTCFIDGQWRDVDRAEYERAKGLRADLARIVYAAPVAAQAPEGWKLVPIERSYDMRVKAIMAFNMAEQSGKDRDDALDAAYRAMLAAAPVAADAAAQPDERAAWDGDSEESRAAFRAYDSVERARLRSKWQVWRDACAWQAARATAPQVSGPKE